MLYALSKSTFNFVKYIVEIYCYISFTLSDYFISQFTIFLFSSAASLTFVFHLSSLLCLSMILFRLKFFLEHLLLTLIYASLILYISLPLVFLSSMCFLSSSYLFFFQIHLLFCQSVLYLNSHSIITRLCSVPISAPG